MSMYAPPREGLSTEDAFERLLSALKNQITAYDTAKGRRWAEVMRNSFSSRSRDTTICWSSCVVLIVESIIILFLHSTNHGPAWKGLLPEGMILFSLAIVSASFVVWENYKRLNEMPKKLKQTLKTIEDLAKSVQWEEANYPDLYMPLSPCISMQWCYRDGRLVNLPWSLLAPGDLIILLPAQRVIAKCRLLNSDEILNRGVPFASHDPQQYEKKESPCFHIPLTTSFAEVLEAPYSSVVEESLNQFLSRPISFYSKERHSIVTRVVECVILPMALMLFVGLCAIRMLYLPNWLRVRVAPWAEIMLLQPITNTLPLIPFALPFLTSFLHCIGNAKIHIFLKRIDQNPGGDSGKGGNRRFSGTSLGWKLFFPEVWKFFRGKEETLHRSQKFLHVLASVTALCCVDKKGVLSWPNPTADKVFFLKTSSPDPKTKRRDVVAEVLDVTHDNSNAFQLQFDDPNWENHLSSLKPIGLNILLNDCNYQTRATYSSFHSHITHELQCNTDSNDLVIPVTSRRCLCELARIIGFASKATDVFKLEQEICSYRHIESDQICRDKLSKARIKFPFPHMMSVIVKEKPCQTIQLMSQGTGDIILDVCEDYWDGNDLRPVTDTESKLILDFYQRFSLTAICAAFAYKPVTAMVSPYLASLYLELPPSQGSRYLSYYPHNLTGESIPPADSISTDCLFNLTEKRLSGVKEVSDLDGTIEMQTRQVFLGMVAMQHEACMDMVQLVEQLDQACIRFVHFSKENELRSRLFSEKMGLESGWNCHISLASSSEMEGSADFHYDSLTGTGEDVRNVPGLTEYLIQSSRPKPVPLAFTTETEDLRKRLNSYTTHLGSGEDTRLLNRCSASVPVMVAMAPPQFDTKDEEVFNSDENVAEKTTTLFPLTFTQTRKSSEDLEDMSLGEKNEFVSPTAVHFVDSTSNFDIKKESYAAENQTSLGFDMSNRVMKLKHGYYIVIIFSAFWIRSLAFWIHSVIQAKLPRGIDEVRPHLENVDNVPLLVSLFTDSTPEKSRQMIQIMQDYGEVVLLLGSVCNVDNSGMFLQADASISLEPMYPQACQQQEIFAHPANGCISPTEMGSLLASLPSALNFRRQDIGTIHHLIALSRHFMNNCARNCLQFWLCCQLSVTVLGLLSMLMLLPPLFTIGDAIWMCSFVIPALSLTLSFATMDSIDGEVMEVASWKNQYSLHSKLFVTALWYYGMKFLPSLMNLVLMASFNLNWICEHLENTTCSWVYPIVPPVFEDMKPGELHWKCTSSWSCGERGDKLLFVQQYTLLFLVVYFIIISACFLYRSKYIWVRNPIVNRVWIVSSVIVLLIQCLYGAILLRSTNTPFDSVSWASFGWACTWVPIVLAINELIRRQEFKVNIRYQKRARLDFGTKLGMNSPF